MFYSWSLDAEQLVVRGGTALQAEPNISLRPPPFLPFGHTPWIRNNSLPVVRGTHSSTVTHTAETKISTLLNSTGGGVGRGEHTYQMRSVPKRAPMAMWSVWLRSTHSALWICGPPLFFYLCIFFPDLDAGFTAEEQSYGLHSLPTFTAVNRFVRVDWTISNSADVSRSDQIRGACWLHKVCDRVAGTCRASFSSSFLFFCMSELSK